VTRVTAGKFMPRLDSNMAKKTRVPGIAAQAEAAAAANVKPNKISSTMHPKVCNCRECSLEYCDCSETEEGTVPASAPAWKKTE